MQINIRIDNLDEITRLMRKFPEPMFRNIQIALRKSALNVELESKKVTPFRTGRLRASIYTEVSKHQAKVAPNTHYAYVVHEGLGTNKYKGRRPYMETGARTSEKKILQYFEEATQKTLNTIK